MVVLKDLVPMSFLLSLSGSVMITHTHTHTHTHRPFRWSCRGAWKQITWHHPMQHVQVYLHRKPLDAAIGRLLTPYRPNCRHGDNQQNNHVKCTLFAGRFYGHHDATVLYRAHHLMEEVRGFHKNTKRHHRASTLSDITNQTHHSRLILTSWKRTTATVDMLATNKNRSVTYQTDGNHISKTIEYLVGVLN